MSQTLIIFLLCLSISSDAFAKLGQLVVVDDVLLEGWEKRKSIQFNMGPDLENLDASLYRKARTDYKCGDGPHFDVQVVIKSGKSILYSYISNDQYGTISYQCYSSDEFTVRDVTNDGIPELLFNTDHFVANGSNIYQQHVITLIDYKPMQLAGLVDVAPSGFRAPQWIEIGKSIYAVIAPHLIYAFDPDPAGRNCTDCRSSYFIAYKWDPVLENFLIVSGSPDLSKLKAKLSLSPN